MYLGRFQLGDTLPLLLLTRDADDALQLPDHPPNMKIWKPDATLLRAEEMPIVEKFAQPGTFLSRVFLGTAFLVGVWTITYHYTIGSYLGLGEDIFEIMPGGNADGHIMSMYFYDRPHAAFIVQSLDSGQLVSGRNPYL